MIYQKKRKKNHREKDNISVVFSFRRERSHTIYCVFSGDWGCSPTSKIARCVPPCPACHDCFQKKQDIKTVQFLFNYASFYPTSLNCSHLSHNVVSFFTDLLLILVSLRYLVYNVMVIIMPGLQCPQSKSR